MVKIPDYVPGEIKTHVREVENAEYHTVDYDRDHALLDKLLNEPRMEKVWRSLNKRIEDLGDPKSVSPSDSWYEPAGLARQYVWEKSFRNNWQYRR